MKQVSKNSIKKSEKLSPAVLNTEELREAYANTDLEFHYVHSKCYELVNIKSKRISDDNILFWFRRMLKDRWTKKIFDRQYERLIKREIKNDMIDYSDWCNAEIMLPEFEIVKRANNIVGSKIREGERLLARLEREGEGFLEKIPEQHIEEMRLAALEEIRIELQRKRSEIYEAARARVKEEERKKISEKRKTLRKLSREERKSVIEVLGKNELLANDLREWEKELFIKEIQILQPEVMELEKKTGKDILTLIAEKIN